jgi:hypothetical protein
MRALGPEGQDVGRIVIRDASEIQRQVVILTAIDDLPAGEETALLYCGLSRARAHLVIVATEKTIERVGRGGGSV